MGGMLSILPGEQNNRALPVGPIIDMCVGQRSTRSTTQVFFCMNSSKTFQTKFEITRTVFDRRVLEAL